MRQALERALLARWYGRPGMLFLLLPLSWLYAVVQRVRQANRTRELPPVPLIVVGNVTVGGAGKTPLVLALVRELQARGYKPGVIARGYGGSGPFPVRVDATTSPAMCGDEPAMMARVTAAPVVVAPKRTEALRKILEAGVDVVVSDDGLQHVALPRSVEIVVVDDERRLGNGHCLPVGPLREPAQRLSRVDFVVGNGGDAGLGAVTMQLRPLQLRSVRDPLLALSPNDFIAQYGDVVDAVAGIGNPARFFATLRRLGFSVGEYPFPDHYAFRDEDLRRHAAATLVMTEKDAIKCRELPALAEMPAWYLPVEAVLPDGFFDAVFKRAGLHVGEASCAVDMQTH